MSLKINSFFGLEKSKSAAIISTHLRGVLTLLSIELFTSRLAIPSFEGD
jgi:hypothetical protein